MSLHINQDVERGHPVDFPVSLRPLFYLGPNDSFRAIREDTGDVLNLVSDRYTFVSHQELLDTMQDAVKNVDGGPVPRGIYVDRGGARMRALYKFPALSEKLTGGDEICPCVQIANTYDGTARIQVSIGVFRFVCTNLAVGGGGVFAGGFMAVHAGEVPVKKVGDELVEYLSRFDQIVAVYRSWLDMPLQVEQLQSVLRSVSPHHAARMLERIRPQDSVYAAYNAATAYATHETRSAAVAFVLLAAINRGFQLQFSNAH